MHVFQCTANNIWPTMKLVQVMKKGQFINDMRNLFTALILFVKYVLNAYDSLAECNDLTQAQNLPLCPELSLCH